MKYIELTSYLASPRAVRNSAVVACLESSAIRLRDGNGKPRAMVSREAIFAARMTAAALREFTCPKRHNGAIQVSPNEVPDMFQAIMQALIRGDLFRVIACDHEAETYAVRVAFRAARAAIGAGNSRQRTRVVSESRQLYCKGAETAGETVSLYATTPDARTDPARVLFGEGRPNHAAIVRHASRIRQALDCMYNLETGERGADESRKARDKRNRAETLLRLAMREATGDATGWDELPARWLPRDGSRAEQIRSGNARARSKAWFAEYHAAGLAELDRRETKQALAETRATLA